MTVLLFGFGPFLEFDENPSDMLVKRLHGTKIAGHQVIGRTLPVDFDALEDQILSSIESAHPSLVLGFGLAAGRDKIAPEKAALNYINSKSKVASGRKLDGVPIADGQPDALFANIPVEALVRELNRNGIPATLSLSAGSHECNYSMYVTFRRARAAGFQAGFIHVPCHAEWVARSGRQFPSLPLETIIGSARCSVPFLLERAGPMSSAR